MKRIPELDGIRGIAILAVLGVHTGTLRGGSHGVDIFFVLSGFLITSILLAEFEATGSIRLGFFYYRRALRLLPAILAYVAFCVLWSIKAPDVFVVPRMSAIASALFYVTNWQLALIPSERLPLGPLSHFWSLSIEEQFYLTWPLLLLAALKLRVQWRVIAGVAIAAAIFSLALRFHLRHESTDLLRIYMGTDTRADGLLIGCACALVKQRVTIPPRLALAAGALIAFLLFTSPTANTYFGWTTIFAVSVCTGIVLLSLATTPAAGIQAVLRSQTLIYFGQRSYSLYLWHFPFTEYLLPRLGIVPVPLAIATVFICSLLAAELSYRFIEQPFLKLKDRLPATTLKSGMADLPPATTASRSHQAALAEPALSSARHPTALS